MLKGRESEGGVWCGAVGLTEASADYENRRRSRTRVPTIGPLAGRLGSHLGWSLEVVLGVSWEASGRSIRVPLGGRCGVSGEPLGGRLGPCEGVHVELMLASLWEFCLSFLQLASQCRDGNAHLCH